MLRVAILGMGSWGQALVGSVQGKSSSLQFTAGCTRTPAKAADFCRTHNIRQVESYDAILADPAIDAVLLATPNSQHSAQVVQAAVAAMPEQRTCKCGSSLKHAIITDPKTVPDATRKKLELLVGKYLS